MVVGRFRKSHATEIRSMSPADFENRSMKEEEEGGPAGREDLSMLA